MLGMTLAHTGIAVFVAGALLVEALNLQTELAVKPGQTVELGGYAFRFEGVEEPRGPTYISDLGHVPLLRVGQPLALMHPDNRAYASGRPRIPEAGIHSGLFGDVHPRQG